jgi:UDP-glucose 4-epimerase
VELHQNPKAVVEKLYPGFTSVFKSKGWTMLSEIDRVYVNEKARLDLKWEPKYDFAYVLDCLTQDKDFRSDLTFKVGIKGYHAEKFDEGPYPVLAD